MLLASENMEMKNQQTNSRMSFLWKIQEEKTFLSILEEKAERVAKAIFKFLKYWLIVLREKQAIKLGFSKLPSPTLLPPPPVTEWKVKCIYAF